MMKKDEIKKHLDTDLEFNVNGRGACFLSSVCVVGYDYEGQQFDTIDEEIEVLEQKIADLDSEMMKSATNSVKLGELMVKKDETEKALEEKMDRWVYLNDLNERILNGE